METDNLDIEVVEGIQYVIPATGKYGLDTNLIYDIDGISVFAPFYTVKRDSPDDG